MSSVSAPDRARTATALVRCVGDPRAFLQTAWGRLPVVHARVEPNGFEDLVSFDDVDRILTTTLLRTPSFRLVQAGTPIPETQYTRSITTGSRAVTGIADPRRIAELFRRGATIVLQGLHRYWEPVGRFAREMELALGHPCQVNAYVTPPGAQGLPLHHDPHDVFVLQAFGQKSWEIRVAPGESSRDPIRLTAQSGDAIYMPKGTPHAASTQEAISGHLTVGVHLASWGDVLTRAWTQVGRGAGLDEPLPAGWIGDPDGFAAALAERFALARRELADVDARALAEEHAMAFLSSRASLLRGFLKDQQELESIDDGSLLERRPASVCELRTRAGRLLVLLGDRRLEMPGWLEGAMDRIASSRSLVVADLADLVPDRGSRLVLARRLVREGLLRPMQRSRGTHE